MRKTMPDASIELSPSAPAPSPTDRHPIGVGDLLTRMTAVEVHLKALIAQVSAMAPPGDTFDAFASDDS
jgi:hypothetical protein